VILSELAARDYCYDQHDDTSLVLNSEHEEGYTEPTRLYMSLALRHSLFEIFTVLSYIVFDKRCAGTRLHVRTAAFTMILQLQFPLKSLGKVHLLLTSSISCAEAGP
jgi:hypothetical protein